MGKGRACIDPFSLNTLIDIEKLKYLYLPSSTECAKNDPFNDWTIVEEYFYEILSDFLDSISNETSELSFEDWEGENTLTDTWETILTNVYLDLNDTISNETSELSFEDWEGENTLTDTWETILTNVYLDLNDTISNENHEILFEDWEGENTLTDTWINELILEKIEDVISNENYYFEFYDDDGLLFYDKDIDIDSDFIDNYGLDIMDYSNDWDMNIVDK